CSGRENYRRAITFSAPDYLPVRLSVYFPWLQEEDERKRRRIDELAAAFPDDFYEADPAMTLRPPQLADGVLRWTDEWGVDWASEGRGIKPCSHPLLSGYDALGSYRFPDPNAPDRFLDIDRALASRGEKYVLGWVWFTLFERLWMLRGFENMLTDPRLHPAEFAALRDRVLEFDLALIDQWLERRADGIFFSDDWGWQRGLLISPDDWRRHYKPSYARMFERVRRGGAHVWMHLCGNVTGILPDLIDIGLNVLNPVQPQAMDVEQLSRDYGGRVCFYGGVDVQGTMVRGTPADVKAEVHRLVRLFGSFDGGYVGGTSHTIMPETPLDNIIALYEAFAEYLP
ncbi:MAG: uroporphyrinogen decarboxylase family protein, partial [Anaerolineae bacterium]|nr:uroporphyrinogen decarboxylase family protein [Anaerolineae bacterium]